MAKTEVKTPEEEKKDKRTKLLTVAVIVFLILVFIVGFIYGLNSVLAMEGAFPPNELTPAKTVLYDTSESSEEEIQSMTAAQLTSYLNTVIADALTNEAKIATDISCGINTDENGYIIRTDNENLLTTLNMLAGDISKGGSQIGKDVRCDYQARSTDFGEDMSDILRVPVIDQADITDYTCTYIYYRCPSCSETSEDDGNECFAVCPKCGSTYGYNIQYKDEYTVTLTLNVDDGIINNNFAPRNETQIRALIGDELNDVADVYGITTAYKALTITFKVNRETDRLTYLAYRKDVTVNMSADFRGKWEALGKTNLTFDYYQTDSFKLTWPGLSLNNHTMTIEPKAEDNLLATLTCSKPTEMTVTWTSDNPDVVSVDDEGYMKACKQDGGSANITASYEFNARTYSDTCTVYVGYPVESTSMSKSKVKLSVGETFALKVKFSPDNSTVKTVKWYTTDEKTATVDQNGVITAVGAGEATVYSLSDDGYFKSSCKVTVQ